jgi:hypothetical protein
MDFLTEIVKEIGDDYTKLAADIDDTERYVDTGSYIFNALCSGSIFGGVSGSLALEKLFSLSLSSKISLTLILTVIVYTLIQRQQLISLFLKAEDYLLTAW